MKENANFPQFKTARGMVSSYPGLISECHLRRLIAQGKCPGYYAGTRFMVNAPALIEMLDSNNRKAVKAQ